MGGGGVGGGSFVNLPAAQPSIARIPIERTQDERRHCMTSVQHYRREGSCCRSSSDSQAGPLREGSWARLVGCSPTRCTPPLEEGSCKLSVRIRRHPTTSDDEERRGIL